MSTARTLAILRKELLETLRDRRTGVVTLVSAILAGPILLLLIFNLIASQAERARDLTLPVVGAEYAPAIVAFFERAHVRVFVAPADYEAGIRRGDLDVVLVIDERFAADVAQGKPGLVRLVFDRSRDRARPAIEQAEALLRAYNRTWGEQRLVLRGEGKCLLFSSHVLQEVAALCDRIVVLAQGRVVAIGTQAELVARAGAGNLEDALIALIGSPEGLAA